MPGHVPSVYRLADMVVRDWSLRVTKTPGVIIWSHQTRTMDGWWEGSAEDNERVGMKWSFTHQHCKESVMRECWNFVGRVGEILMAYGVPTIAPRIRITRCVTIYGACRHTWFCLTLIEMSVMFYVCYYLGTQPLWNILKTLSILLPLCTLPSYHICTSVMSTIVI